MNLGLASARVLVTAGASGIGLAIAREFVTRARKCTCAMSTRGRWARLLRATPAVTSSHCDVSEETAVESALRRTSGTPRRPRRAGQQRRHRRAHRAL